METPCVVIPITFRPAFPMAVSRPARTAIVQTCKTWTELRQNAVYARGAKAFPRRLRPPLGQRGEDRLRPMAGEDGGDVLAYLKPPVWALLIGARKVCRDRFAGKVIELGVREHRC